MHTEYQGAGIYYITGDPIPMQLLITPELSGGENYWIQSMRTDLRAGEEIRKLMREYEKHRKSKDYACDESDHKGKLGTDGGGKENV